MNIYLTSDMFTWAREQHSFASGANYRTAAHRGTVDPDGYAIAWTSYSCGISRFAHVAAGWSSGVTRRANWYASDLIVKTQ